MKCPKCGNECAKGNNFCSKCGAQLIRTCRKCGRVLKDEELFCPECGTDNRPEAEKTEKNSKKKKSSFLGVLGFVLVVVIVGISLATLIASQVFSYRIVWKNGVLQKYSFDYLKLAGEILLGAILLFSIIFRITKKAGWGVVSIVLSSLVCVFWLRDPASLVVLIGTIMSYKDRKEES